MSTEINKYAKQTTVPGTRRIAAQLVNYPDAINLTIGQPDFPTPEAVKQAGIKAIEADQTGYSVNMGIIELREAINSFFTDKYGFSYDPETEIVVTSGSSEGLDSVLRTILNEGDEVIIPSPTYMAYTSLLDLSGAKPVFLDTSDTDFIPSAERLEALITDKTKAIIFNYPSNPTGMTLSKEDTDKLVEVLAKHDIFILADEIYSENVFVGEHHSFAAYPEIKDRLFLVHGVSKSHSMTGWRVGYVLGPAELMQYVSRIHSYNCVCASLPGQYATVEALNNCRDIPEEMNVEYKRRRDYVYDRLQKMGLETVLPNGAFYIFPSIKKFGISSEEFCDRLLAEGGVAALAGSVFTDYGEGFIRISYSYAMSELEKGMDRLEKFVEKIEQEVSAKA